MEAIFEDKTKSLPLKRNITIRQLVAFAKNMHDILEVTTNCRMYYYVADTAHEFAAAEDTLLINVVPHHASRITVVIHSMYCNNIYYTQESQPWVWWHIRHTRR